MFKRSTFLFFTLLPCILFSQYQRPGSSSAQFLDIGVSARAEGMAGSYISVVDGAEGVYYNPAVIARLDGTEATFTYTKWFADINHEFLSISQKIGQIGTIGLSLTGVHTDEMIVRTPLQPDGTGETFYSGSLKAGITFARELTDHVSVGLTGNLIRTYLFRDFIENSYAGDIAVLYDVGVRNFRIGFKIANFGSSIKFVHESYPMPTFFSFGMSLNVIELSNQELLASLSATKPNDGSPQLASGIEYNFQKLFFIRGGYNFDDVVRTFAFGIGARFLFGGYQLNTDFSYNDFSDLGGVQRFSIGFRF
jgi:hypothetical protein